MLFQAMNPWCAKAVILVGTLAIVIIPASVHQRGGARTVVKSRKGRMERVLLTLTSIGFLLPLVWVAAPVFAFADYPLRPVAFFAGIFCLSLGLWLLYRSHADLGTNWSITLEIQEKHQLVTQGVYRHVRHPMYLALLLYSSGQALVVPNLVAGPSYLVAFAFLFAFRVGPEERMMLEEFGKGYEAYMARTKRLVPGVW
jgi:protein-S-isoprenylcysteine O-methyltransferase Ste14